MTRSSIRILRDESGKPVSAVLRTVQKHGEEPCGISAFKPNQSKVIPIAA